MTRSDLIPKMVKLLHASLEEHGSADLITAAPDSPLVGADAVVSSLALVSFVTDVEATLVEDYGFETVLVNEKALSRKNSPFRTIDALADYILELAEEAGRVPVGQRAGA